MPPRLIVSPASAPLDAPLALRVVGLDAGAQVMLRARTEDDADRRWASVATFQAGPDGTVDPARDAPLSGSYTGTDSTGLLWSMTPADEEGEPAPFAKTNAAPVVVRFLVDVAGHTAAEAEVIRWLATPGVSVSPVREDGLVGTFFQPAGDTSRAAILTLGGSSGGLRESVAALLATHGYATLALAYFGVEGLPARLEAIPLEYFARALAWLAAQPGIRADRLALLGNSRGAELALLLGAIFPAVSAVAAYAPSSVVWGAVGQDAPAWTWQGAPLARTPNRVSEEESARLFAAEPYVAAPWYRLNLADPAAREAAAIPVERINGPVLLFSGEDDALWPSTLMAGQVMQRLAAHAHPYPDQHLAYPAAGHLFDLPNLPATITARRNRATGHTFAYGGTPAGNAAAARASWAALLAFLSAWRG